jgi:hypothetical protein
MSLLLTLVTRRWRNTGFEPSVPHMKNRTSGVNVRSSESESGPKREPAHKPNMENRRARLIPQRWRVIHNVAEVFLKLWIREFFFVSNPAFGFFQVI